MVYFVTVSVLIIIEISIFVYKIYFFKIIYINNRSFLNISDIKKKHNNALYYLTEIIKKYIN